MPGHANLVGIDLHSDKRIKDDVRAASTANVNTALPGASLDGVTLASGDRVLLKNQSAAAENGIYVWTSGVTALTRASDANSAALFVYGFKVFVREGTANAATYWTFTTTAAITLGTTSLSFVSDAGTGTFSGGISATTGTFSGEVQATDFKATGLTGATQASRYVGATTSGAPVSGTFVTGDYIIDRTGKLYICTTGGTPGTWVAEGFVNPMTTTGDLIVGGSSGTPTRLAAGTTAFVLTSTGTSSAPSWQAATGGSGGTSGTGGTGGSIVPIQTQTPSGVGTITFTVPAGFKNIRITGHARGTQAATSTQLQVQFNGDTGSNYEHNITFTTSGASNGTASGPTTFAQVAEISAASAPSGAADAIEIFIPDHAGTTFQKVGVGRNTITRSTTVSANNFIESTRFYWRSTAAITSVTLTLASGNYDVGSTFTLWGESDAAPALLTTNSNLISETILAAAQATISIPNIPQGYKDLRVSIDARGDAAATSANLLMQFNGDTSTNYDYQPSSTNGGTSTGVASASSILLGRMSANTAPASASSGSQVTVFDYAATTFHKTTNTSTTVKLGTGSTQYATDSSAGFWKSTAAITSIALSLSSGNFVAGTTVRVYGEPASAAGPSVGTGTRLRISSNVASGVGSPVTIPWDVEDNDADNQHFTSAAALTGTVSKSSGGSTTITGSGTAFLTELSIGQVISIPGGAVEQVVVTAIASNTSLTCFPGTINASGGQTATRLNSAVVFRQPGFYSVEFNAYLAAVSAGTVSLSLRQNNATIIGQNDVAAINASAGYQLVVQKQFQQWDYIEALTSQGSGGSVGVQTDERTHLAVTAKPTVIVAVPYVNIQDQKAANTDGGTFTNGAWRTRVLNTVVSDIAGIASLASNQITLSPGTYRCSISVPGFFCGTHTTRLQNITASSTVLSGTSEATETSSTLGTQTRSLISGKFILTTSAALEVQHQCAVTKASNGLGHATNFGAVEIYTNVELWKEG